MPGFVWDNRVDTDLHFLAHPILLGCQHRALDARGTRRLADVERDLIRTRTAEGRDRAKAQGKPTGPTPFPETPAQQKEATRRRARGATLQELAKSYNVGISTIRRATRAA